MKKEFETEDIKVLYTAFTELCDYIEEEVGCGKCPRYHTFCTISNKKDKEFGEALARIREMAEIPNP